MGIEKTMKLTKTDSLRYSTLHLILCFYILKSYGRNIIKAIELNIMNVLCLLNGFSNYLQLINKSIQIKNLFGLLKKTNLYSRI